jgi:membrane associated rhomboid family serine protease
MSERPREPIFNVPAIVVILIAIFVAVHFGRELLDRAQEERLLWTLAFVPARLGEFGNRLPGAPWAAYSSFVTHMLVHGDLIHLGVNSAWLLAVGTPVARRMSWPSFLLFAILCGVGGALMFLAVNPGLRSPMIGASGAISGLMAATFRLIYAAKDFHGQRVLRERTAFAPALSLAETLQSRPALTAILVWVAINLVFGLGIGDMMSGAGIAWEAHLGGFFTGLVLYGLFDRRLRLRQAA